MAAIVRKFNCLYKNCNKEIIFDLKKILKPETNFVTCDGCKVKFYGTLKEDCCGISVLFVSEKGKKAIKTFKK